MHANFGTHEPVSVITTKLNGRRFNACFFAFLHIEYAVRHVLAFKEARVHAQQHGSPILRFGATSASIDIHQRWASVVLTREHFLEFHILDTANQRENIIFNRSDHFVIAFGLSHFKDLGQVITRRRSLFPIINQILDLADLL